MDEGIDDLIDLLNHQEMPASKGKPPKKVKQPAQDTAANLQDLTNLEQVPDFNALYSARMQKMERKNESRQEELTRKKKYKQQLEKQSKESNLLANVTGEAVEKKGLRYLIFKNWSGDHMGYESEDRGYKYRFSNGVVGLIKHLLEENGFVEGQGNEGVIIWNNGVVPTGLYQSLGAYQKINHFPKSFEITRKDLMLQHLSKMKHRFPREYSFFPETYILPQESSIFMSSAEKHKGERWFIVKPHNSSQGKGIWLSSSAEEVLQKQKECIVVSEYIHNPLLVKGLKFDMRIYVGVTCWNPLRIYVFEDGLTRFATHPYSNSLGSKDNLYAHLTNYSLNKYSENFEANDDLDEQKGHKWSLFALREHLKQEGLDVGLAWTRIDDLIIKTLLSIQNTVFNAMEMSVPYRTNCFEVLGFDILLDDSLRPWLLEINLSPSLNTDSPLDLKIKGSMVADLFTMIGVVPPDQQFAQDKSYLLNQNRMTTKGMMNEMNKLERMVLKQSEEEEKRSGGWRKIFPLENAVRYKPFFDMERPLNRVLRDEELKRFKMRNASTNYNQAVRGLGDNPQQSREKRV